MGWIILFLACSAIIHPVSGFCEEEDVDLWKALRLGTSFVLLRHAIAPGTGDPDQFVLGDCSTQRNLSDLGRDQAAAIGALFRAKRRVRGAVLGLSTVSLQIEPYRILSR